MDIGNINLSLKLADGVTSLVEAALLPKITAELAAMENRLRNQKIPTSQGSTE